MIINYLADCPEEAITIACWYFDEWGYAVPDLTVNNVLDKLNAHCMGRDGFPAMLTLHENEILCACTELKFRENKHHPECEHWIGGVYVEKNSRGKGYAAALVEKAKAISTQENIALYLKCGFKTLHDFEHNGFKTTIMVWQNTKC